MLLIPWLLSLGNMGERGLCWNHSRIDWEGHVEQLYHEHSFGNEYMMSPTAHSNLVSMLAPALLRDQRKSRFSPILVEHVIALGLRTLGGGRIKDLRHIIGTSRPAAYAALDDFRNLTLSFQKVQGSGKKSTRDSRAKVPVGLLMAVSAQLMDSFSGPTRPVSTR